MLNASSLIGATSTTRGKLIANPIQDLDFFSSSKSGLFLLDALSYSFEKCEHKGSDSVIQDITKFNASKSSNERMPLLQSGDVVRQIIFDLFQKVESDFYFQKISC